MNALRAYPLMLALLPITDRCRVLLDAFSHPLPATVCEAPVLTPLAPEAAGGATDLNISVMECVQGGDGMRISLDVPNPCFAKSPPERNITFSMRGVETGRVDSAILKLVYDALNGGGESPRLPKWREPLLRMLSEGTRGTDFDAVYRLLLAGFPGPDDRTRIQRLSRWIEGVESEKVRGDVFRAETRYWLNAGEPELAVAAADRMQAEYPPYVLRACRLKALAYASAGELETAKGEIAAARTHQLPKGERLELLYIEAWIALQDGDTDMAERNLRAILKESPSGALARKTRQVLESLEEEKK